jgi:hypothetical protein
VRTVIVRGRRRALLGFLLAGSLLLSPLSATPVSAAISCQESIAFANFVGTKSDHRHHYAVRAKIRDRPINLCAPNDGDSGSSIWVMLVGEEGFEYAQIGYYKVPGMASPKAFIQYDDGSGGADFTHVDLAGIWASGAQHTYVIDYSQISGRLHFSVDGLNKGQTSFSPDTAWHTPWHGQFYAETLDSGDDVPGTASARADWSLVAFQALEPGAWGWIEGEGLTSPYAFYKATWSHYPDAFQTYTQR